MKKNYLLFVVATSFLMCGCLKNEDFISETTYTGRVVNEQNQPIANRKVVVARVIEEPSYRPPKFYGEIATAYTDASGNFIFTIDYRTVPSDKTSDHYIIVEPCTSYQAEKLLLKGLGERSYDYGVIVIKKRA